jgi:hypothetical protein
MKAIFNKIHQFIKLSNSNIQKKYKKEVKVKDKIILYTKTITSQTILTKNIIRNEKNT